MNNICLLICNDIISRSGGNKQYKDAPVRVRVRPTFIISAYDGDDEPTCAREQSTLGRVYFRSPLCAVAVAVVDDRNR